MKYPLGRCTINCCGLAIVASCLLGCSVHPLPQDVSYASTIRIVSRIRCEAKAGLETALSRAEAVGPDRKRHVEKIVAGTTIGFEFSFIMAEDNKAAGGQLTFKRKDLEEEGFTLQLVGNLNNEHGSDDNRTRKNTRVFRIIDDLQELHDAKCGRRMKTTGPNLAHPITGSTGMAEVVRTYVELETLTNLAAGNSEIITFSDKLDFTTTLEVGAFADLELKMVVGSLRLTNASVTGSALRKDFHSVKVVLARDPAHADVDLSEGETGTKRAKKGPAMTTEDFAALQEIRGKRLQRFLAQRKAFGRNRVVIELDRQRIVDQDKAVAARVLGIP